MTTVAPFELKKPLVLTSPPTVFDTAQVSDVQKLLSGQNVFNENFRPGAIDGQYGPASAGAAFRCKYLLGYPTKLDNHSVGQELVDFLTGKAKLSATYAARRTKREEALHEQNTIKLKALQIAQSFIGVTEEPPGSNLQQFGKWYGFNGVAWCCIFVTYCQVSAGNNNFVRGSFASYVNAVADEAIAGHRHLSITTDPQEGDLIDYNNGEHIEIFVKWVSPGSTFIAVGGNTSSSNGSQSNGGEVAQNTRYVNGDFPVTHFIRIGA